MAPEYIAENILSTKVDVFSFGLLVLETISGRTAYSFRYDANENLAKYVSMIRFYHSRHLCLYLY